MIFDSKKTINTFVYDCKLKSNEYNWTTNHSILKTEPTLLTASFALYSKSEYGVYNTIDMQTYRIEDPEIHKTFRSNKFHTYITNIDFCNRYGQVVMTATLPQPLRKSKLKDMKIKVQMDY